MNQILQFLADLFIRCGEISAKIPSMLGNHEPPVPKSLQRLK